MEGPNQRKIESQSEDEIWTRLHSGGSGESLRKAFQDALSKLMSPNLYALETDGSTYARVVSRLPKQTVYYTEVPTEIATLKQMG